MATEIYLVKVGMTMTEGMVEEWYVPDGGTVEKGELLYRLETEKVNLDVDADAERHRKARRRRGRDDAAGRRHRAHLCARRSDPLDGAVSVRGRRTGCRSSSCFETRGRRERTRCPSHPADACCRPRPHGGLPVR